MGVLNVTPDSFSDGGRYFDVQQAIEHAGSLIEAGAAILDIGGESTRPGAQSVSEEEELRRVVPVLQALRHAFPDTLLSVDTSKPAVMQAVIDEGASIINDVCALQAEGALEVIANSNVGICLMHMQGQPRTMQQNPNYDDVVGEVSDFLSNRIEACLTVGIDLDRIVIDPGFGFGKQLGHNLALLAELQSLASSKVPILAGLSRKSMIGQILKDRPVEGRLIGSVTAALIAAQHGASILRVHDVAETRDALEIWQAVMQAQSACDEQEQKKS